MIAMIAFLATMVIGTVFLAVSYLIINILKRREKMQARERKDNSGSTYYFKTEGVVAGDELKAEFFRLVTAIAYYNFAQLKKKCPAAHYSVVAEDMKNAFLQAVEEVYLVSQKHELHCGIGAVLDRMKQIRKKYEAP